MRLPRSGARAGAVLVLTLLGCQGASSDECGSGDSCSTPPFVVDGISYNLTCGGTLPVGRLGQQLADVAIFGGNSTVREIQGVPASTLVAIQVGGSDAVARDDESVPCGRAGAWLPGLPVDGDFRDSVLALCEVAQLSPAQRVADECPTPTPSNG